MQINTISVNARNRESTRHGTHGFPMAVYNSILSRNVLGYTRLHWHEELQFCAVVQGTVTFSVNEASWQLETGDGIFINSGYLHMARPLGNPDAGYICLDIHPRLLCGFPGSVLEQDYVLPALSDPVLTARPLYQRDPWQADVLQKICEIYQESETKKPSWELLATARVYEIFAAVLCHQPSDDFRTRKWSRANTVAQRILSYLTAHYGEKITLAQIAAYASYTESECCRIFKRFTGESIFAYLRELRLEQSVRLLDSTDQSISEIGESCGFRSPSYYIEAFRQQFHCTPFQYRKKKRT